MKTMMILFAVLACTLAEEKMVNLANKDPRVLQALFKNFQHAEGRHYANAQEARMRLKNFRRFVSIMARANEEDDGAEYGVTFFADLTQAEAEQYLGFNNLTAPAPAPEEEAPRSDFVGADAVDHKHRLGPARVQGDCGSCWAFTTVAVLEAWSHIKTDKVISLSDQQVLDCSGGYGCTGGWYFVALKTIAANGNHLASNEAYPYKPVKGECKRDSHESALPIKIARVANARGESEVTAQVTKGPVAVAMDFTKIKMQGYHDGIYTPDNCGTRPTRAVALTGYTADYWEVRNSWGPGWGQKGYLQITRKIPNVCGILNYAYYITVGSQEELE